jgi:hypothetical protein
MWPAMNESEAPQPSHHVPGSADASASATCSCFGVPNAQYTMSGAARSKSDRTLAI